MLTALMRRFLYFPNREDLTVLKGLAAKVGLEPWMDRRSRLLGWRRPSGLKGRPVRCLLVFHGNAGFALDRTYFVEGFESLGKGWDVYLFEYPGYGARSGSPSEKAIKNAAQEATRELLSSNRQVYLLGESLGSAVAAHIASVPGRQASGIVLVTPFTSLADVARRNYPFLPVDLIMSERYDSVSALKSYGGPAAFIIAELDEIVSAESGLKLFEGYNGPKRLWLQKGKCHNTLAYRPSEKWWKEVAGFITSPFP